MFKEKSFGIKVLGVKMILLLPDLLKLCSAALCKQDDKALGTDKQAAVFTMFHEESFGVK
jgi:hypothetical protein